MSRPTGIRISKKIEGFFRFKYGCLIRMPHYGEDYKRYQELLTEQGHLEDLFVDLSAGNVTMSNRKSDKCLKRKQAVDEEISKILKYYDTHFMPNPDKPDDWKSLHAYHHAVLPTVPEHGWIFADMTRQCIKTYRIDIWRGDRIIWRELSEWINEDRKEEKAKGVKRQRFDRAPHLSKWERYLAVFDQRNQKPPVSYKKIVALLHKKYEYKDPKKAEASARHDFQIAFESIYRIPYKESDKEQFKKLNFKECTSCPIYKTCKERCAKVEYLISKEEVKQKDMLGRNKDVRGWAIYKE